MAKRVLITGASGQDAAYMAQACLADGDHVIGVVRVGTDMGVSPLHEIGLASEVTILERELDCVEAVRAVLHESAPDQIYNLAGLSSVFASFADPVGTTEANAMIPLYFLEVLRSESSRAAFVQASTGEIFGATDGVCDEISPMAPMSPYAVTKAFAQQMVRLFRSTSSLPSSSAILFAHESPLRGLQFLTRKVTSTLARMRHGRAELLELGNLSAERDWGYAGDYMQGMRLIASASVADDFVLASGQSHSVRAFVDKAASWFGFDLEWDGEEVGETARDRRTGALILRVNPEFFRPTDAGRLIGSPRKAEAVLGWRRTIDFDALVAAMARADDERAGAGLI